MIPFRNPAVSGRAILDWTKTIGCTAVEAADRLYEGRPEWVEGYVSHFDARYLQARTLASESHIVAEIGTASGVSTAVLCQALSLASRAGLIGDDFEVRTYDLNGRYYADEAKQTGDAAREMLPPELLSHVVFRSPVTAAAVTQDHGPDALDLMFVDADHRHPWPALDLLATLDSLRPGAEVVFHDINLPVRHPEFADWGVKHLFDGLNVEKQANVAESVPNIGSVWIPDDKEGLKEQLLEIVRAHEWETSVPPDVSAPLLG